MLRNFPEEFGSPPEQSDIVYAILNDAKKFSSTPMWFPQYGQKQSSTPSNQPFLPCPFGERVGVYNGTTAISGRLATQYHYPKDYSRCFSQTSKTGFSRAHHTRQWREFSLNSSQRKSCATSKQEQQHGGTFDSWQSASSERRVHSRAEQDEAGRRKQLGKSKYCSRSEKGHKKSKKRSGESSYVEKSSRGDIKMRPSLTNKDKNHKKISLEVLTLPGHKGEHASVA
jgi:hypothetical protein